MDLSPKWVKLSPKQTIFLLVNTEAAEVVKGIADGIDCNLYLFDTQLTTSNMYAVVVCSVLVLIGAHVILNVVSSKRASRVK